MGVGLLPAEVRPEILAGVHQPQAVTSPAWPGSLGTVCVSGWQLSAKRLDADKSCSAEDLSPDPSCVRSV